MTRPARWQLGSPRDRLAIAVGLAALCGLVCWLEWRSLASASDSLAVKRTRLAAVRTDIDRILSLQHAPRQATDRRMPHDALIAMIDQSLRPAGLDPRTLTSVWPESPRRRGASDYLQLTTRLNFEKVTLEQITRFAHHLDATDASLHLTSVRILSQQHAAKLWDVELAVAYRIYAPRSRTSHTERRVAS